MQIFDSTSGMTTAPKRKPAYDPARQWGLKPEPERDTGSATYIMSGHIVSGGADVKSMFVSENMGRDAQAKAARKSSTRDADLELQKLLKRDKEGTKAVAAARDHAKKLSEQQAREKSATRRGTKAKKDDASSKEREPLTGDGNNESAELGKSVYSVSLIRTLGFDPTGKDGRKAANRQVQNKVCCTGLGVTSTFAYEGVSSSRPWHPCKLPARISHWDPDPES